MKWYYSDIVSKIQVEKNVIGLKILSFLINNLKRKRRLIYVFKKIKDILINFNIDFILIGF